MLPYVFALLFWLQSPATQPAPDEIKDVLSRAESLYYEAKFNDSIKLLLRLNDVLQTKTDDVQDRINTKLLLALNHLGLNESAAAKSLLIDVFALDPEYVLDPQQFSPKVVALAGDAKTQQMMGRCQAAVDTARKSVAAGDAAGVLDVLRSMRPKCPDLAGVEAGAADLVYKKGLADYKQNDFPSAQQSFRTALKLAPGHELAAQYLELTDSKLQLSEDRVLLRWQKNFDTHEYKAAASDYRDIVVFDGDSNGQALNHVTTEYRKALTTLVDVLNQTCSANDPAKMVQIRGQISELLPEPQFAKDIQSKMVPCTPPAAPMETKAAPAATLTAKIGDSQPVNRGCFQMEARLALTRLKVRTEPEITREIRAFVQNAPITVKVKATIAENGNVTIAAVQGSNAAVNNAVRTAVEHWKFSPAMDSTGARCVETEFPIVIGK
jgi:tetratricopeptide (TPR) repeat protein